MLVALSLLALLKLTSVLLLRADVLLAFADTFPANKSLYVAPFKGTDDPTELTGMLFELMIGTELSDAAVVAIVDRPLEFTELRALPADATDEDSPAIVAAAATRIFEGTPDDSTAEENTDAVVFSAVDTVVDTVMWLFGG